jgi:ribosomal protein S18 acetylase RimI-like enzyme
MPRSLIAEVFNSGKLGQVAGFVCGDRPWSQFAAQWIKGSPQDKSSASYGIDNRGNQVWLYYTDDTNELVGFGSLGSTKWPEFNERVTLIPQLAVATRFKGQPKGPGEVKFSHQIMDDLIGRAMLMPSRHLVLTVDPGNPAIALYQTFEFRELPDRSPMGHIKMALYLPEPLPPAAVAP